MTDDRNAQAWSFAEKALPRRRLPVLLMIVAVTVAGVAGALAVRSGGSLSPSPTPPMSLTLSFREDQSFAYLLDIVIDAETKVDGSFIPMDMDFQQKVSGRVVSMDQDGVASVRVVVKTLSATANAAPVPSNALPVCRTTLRIAPDGRILRSSGLLPGSFPGSSSPLPSFDQLTPLLPDEPVAPGDTWSKSYEQPWPLGDGSLRMDSASRLLRHEQVGGIETAVIQTTSTIPLDLSVDLDKVAEALGKSDIGFPLDGDPKLLYRGELRFDETSWFDASEGRLVSSNGTGRFSVAVRAVDLPAEAGFPGRELKMNGRMTVNAQLVP